MVCKNTTVGEARSLEDPLGANEELAWSPGSPMDQLNKFKRSNKTITIFPCFSIHSMVFISIYIVNSYLLQCYLLCYNLDQFVPIYLLFDISRISIAADRMKRNRMSK